MFNFEKLTVWQKSVDFADLVYRLTKNFPPSERFELTNQMRRAAVSVSANIAEGSSRNSQNDFARFLDIASGSVFEVVSHATIGLRQGLVTQQDYRKLYLAAEEQSKMLSSLRKSILKS